MSAADPSLVLASTSRYRAALLSRVVDAFEQVAPGVEESRRANEGCRHLAIRLASEKARAVSMRCPDAVVIGSDQVADLDDVALAKPGTIGPAREQLAACSGRSVTFHTAVCVLDGRTGAAYADVDTTHVVFRTLDGEAIERYLARDQPFDCAGSFRVESAGITLFERVDSTDPTALVGLPLIIVCRLLRLTDVVLP